jgi:glucuronokinase
MIETRAYARAGLLGNPSDGYYGKVIAITVKNFFASVFLEESAELGIEPPGEELNFYRNLRDLYEEISRYGYYGGIRLVLAALKKFCDYCLGQKISLPEKNFTLRYKSGIPRQVGLGGSSAIITAAFRALMKFYGVDIPYETLPSLVLDAERQELEINAGYMDRVVQVYEGCIYMDLDERFIKEWGFGVYERLDPKLLPDLYIAYKPLLGKVSGIVLNEIRQGFERADPFFIQTLQRIAGLAEKGRQALLEGNRSDWHGLMNENFDLRSRIMTISESNMEMIRAARSCGASAKFAGSGGSIVGMYEGEEMYGRLVAELAKLRAIVLKPIIT